MRNKLLHKHSLTHPLMIASSIFICIFAATARLSVSIKAIALIIALVLLACSGNWITHLQKIKRNKIAIAALLLFAAHALGTLHGITTWNWRLIALKTTLPLVYIALLIPLFAHDERFSTWVMDSYIIGTTIVLIIGLLNASRIITLYWIVPDGGAQNLEYPFGLFNFAVSFCPFLCAQMIKKPGKKRWFYLTALIFSSYFILFINKERTVYILYFLLLMLYIYQHVPKKWGALSLLVVCLAFASAYHFSPIFKNGINRALVALYDLDHGNSDTSTGLRFVFLQGSYKLWKEHPILGSGTGSFLWEYAKIGYPGTNGKPSSLQNPVDQPHNEFAYIAVQIGLVGLLLWVYLLVLQVIAAQKLTLLYRRCAQGFLLAFIAGCFVESMLFYTVPGGYFALFAAMFFHTPRENKAERTTADYLPT